MSYIKQSFINQSNLLKNEKYVVKKTTRLTLTAGNIFRTTSLTDLMINNGTVYLRIKKNVGTPGIFIATPKIKPNKLYRLSIKHNKKYSLFQFLVYKKGVEYITYNKNNLANNQVIFDTFEIEKYNMIALCVSVPALGTIEIYDVLLHELAMY